METKDLLLEVNGSLIRDMSSKDPVAIMQLKYLTLRHLFVAAPALLHSLETMLAWREHHARILGLDPNRMLDVRLARSAIAKARGIDDPSNL